MSVPPVGPLGYTGTVAVPFLVENSSPTSSDFKNFSVPTIWSDPSTESAWILTAKPHDSAKWYRFVTGGSSISFLQGNNTSVDVGPNTDGVVKIVGTSGQIDVSGNAGTNTLTLSLSGGGTAIDSFQPDGGTNPVIPTTLGLVRMGSGASSAGNAQGIKTVGGTNALDFQTNFATVNTSSGALTFYDPSNAATTFFAYTSPSATAEFAVASLDNSFSEPGNITQITVVNTSNAASSSGRFVANATNGSGDAYFMTNAHLGAGSPVCYQIGQTQADLFKLTTTTNTTTPYVISGTTILQASTAGLVSIPTGDGTAGLVVGGTSIGTNDALTVTGTGTGTLLQLSVRASSTAIPIFGVFSGDAAVSPVIEMGVNSISQWSFGVNASSSNAFQLWTGAGIGGGTLIQSTTTGGSVIKPKQPAFAAYLSASTSNDVTGDGTVYTVICNTENGDQQGNYDNATGTFTCPTTGVYLFTWYVTLQNLDAGHTSGYNHVSGSNDLRGTMFNVGAARDTGNTCTLSASAMIFMTAANTVNSKVTVGGGTKTVGITGGVDGDNAPYTYFTAALIC